MYCKNHRSKFCANGFHYFIDEKLFCPNIVLNLINKKIL